MYDPRNNPFYFPELDDPQFWSDVAGRCGVPPDYYQSPPPEAFYAPAPIPYPPEYMVVEGSLVRLPETSALVPYQQAPLPVYGPPITEERPAQQTTPRPKSNEFLKIFLWFIAIVLAGSLLSSVLTQKSSTPTVVGPPNSSYSLYGNPSISAQFIDKVLAHYGSPAAGEGETLYDLGVQYKVDPVFPLGFFMKESTFGTAGVARYTLSLSNMRCVPQYACYHDPVNGDYAMFSDWQSSFEAWYALLTGPVYKGSKLTAIDQITWKYAPTQDHNDPGSYACFVKYATDTWRAGTIVVSNPSPAYCASH